MNKMANQKLKLEDFEEGKLSKNQQKKVRGGDGEDPPTDPGKTGGGTTHG
ncbi:rSAM-modified peptide [Flavobacterium sp. MR2016-29]|nr:rSAM-modified peptide [Flavobacterium sp. MR2016-29]